MSDLFFFTTPAWGKCNCSSLDQEVTSSTPSWHEAVYLASSWQPSSTVWSVGSDDQWLGAQPGLASHWTCVTDFSGLTTYRFKVYEGDTCTPPMLHLNMSSFINVQIHLNTAQTRTRQTCSATRASFTTRRTSLTWRRRSIWCLHLYHKHHQYQQQDYRIRSSTFAQKLCDDLYQLKILQNQLYITNDNDGVWNSCSSRVRIGGWGLTALLTQNRSYRACKFVGIFHSKL